jgi:hypothetical protein
MQGGKNFTGSAASKLAVALLVVHCTCPGTNGVSQKVLQQCLLYTNQTVNSDNNIWKAIAAPSTNSRNLARQNELQK